MKRIIKHTIAMVVIVAAIMALNTTLAFADPAGKNARGEAQQEKCISKSACNPSFFVGQNNAKNENQNNQAQYHSAAIWNPHANGIGNN